MAKSKKNIGDMTEGPIWQKLLNLSAPMVFGIMAVMSISIVDTYFVGELGMKPLAALSFTFPVAFTIMSLAIGLSAGSASVVSRAIGSKNEEKTKSLSTDSIMLSFIVVLILSIIGYLTIRPLFSFMGADDEVLNMTERYMKIWYISMPFLVIPMVVNALIRAAGDAFWPSLIMIVSALINVTLTPMMIHGWYGFPAWDIEGAAIATLIAHIFAFIFAGAIIIFKKQMITLNWRGLEKTCHSWLEITKIAMPAAAGNALYPLTTGIVTSILAAYGDEAVAAYGSATRIEAFACIPMFALSSAIGPICGQNWGAGKKDRVFQAQKQSFLACLTWSIFLFIAFLGFAPWLANQFTPNPTVADFIKNYLLIISATFWGYGVSIIAAGCYNGIGKPFTALSYYAIRCALMYAPFCWIVSLMFDDVVYMFYAIALANVLSGVLIAYDATKRCKA